MKAIFNFNPSHLRVEIEPSNMFILITSRIIAVILTSISVWVVAVAIKNYDEPNCVLGCDRFWGSMLIAGVILFGAVVSASIDQLSKRRSRYVKWPIRIGGLIFFLGSIPGAVLPSFVGFFLAILALAMILMISWPRRSAGVSKKTVLAVRSSKQTPV